MSQSIHLRSRPVIYSFIFIFVVLIGSALYWTLDKYVINPDVSFESVDAGSKQVNFETAPAFRLPDINSNFINLKDYSGKIVIVNFWASWCAPCIEEFPSLMKFVEKFKGQVVLFAISQDSKMEDVQKFLNQFGASTSPHFQILLDLNRKTGMTYGVQALPESFIFAKNFRFHRKIIGYRNWLSPISVKEIDDLNSNESPASQNETNN